MQFEDPKKKYEIVFDRIVNKGIGSTPVFLLKMEKPVKAEARFEVSSIKTQQGYTGININKYSDIAKELKSKGKDVLIVVAPEAIDYVRKTHDNEIEKVKQEAQKTPETWFWAIGGDTMTIYATPNSETKTEFREDLQKVEKTIENKIKWTNNPLEAVSKRIDRKTGLYTFNGWFEVSHEDVMKIYHEIIAETEAKKAETQDNEIEIFEKAKQTGEKQVIETYMDECDDPDESCDVDLVTIWAMPDGTKKTTRNHTW